MGSGTFSASAYRSYANATTINKDGSAKSRDQVFQQRRIHPMLSPTNVAIRESVDSQDNPNSRAIILATDVTGSLGDIAHTIVSKHLGTLMELIMGSTNIGNPHVMFMGVGDIEFDEAPLQVSQFEADLRIAEQLINLYVEGRGGSNGYESYHLPWYFAAYHTKIDCWDKRQLPGFLFTWGDEHFPEHPAVSQRRMPELMGNTLAKQADMNPMALFKAARERYETFHIIIEEGSCARRNYRTVVESWHAAIGNRALLLSDQEYLPQLVMATIRVAEGEDINDVCESFQDPKCISVLKHAFSIDAVVSGQRGRI